MTPCYRRPAAGCERAEFCYVRRRPWPSSSLLAGGKIADTVPPKPNSPTAIIKQHETTLIVAFGGFDTVNNFLLLSPLPKAAIQYVHEFGRHESRFLLRHMFASVAQAFMLEGPVLLSVYCRTKRPTLLIIQLLVVVGWSFEHGFGKCY